MFQVSPSLGRLRLPGRQEHEVELLLNRRVVRCVTSYLMRWRGNSSADDEWLQLEEPAEKVAEYEAAGPGGAPSGRPPGRLLGFHPACRSPAGSLPASRGALPVPACGPVRGRDRVGRVVLFRWPTDGWVRGTVARLSLAAVSHASSGMVRGLLRRLRTARRAGGPCSVRRARRGPAEALAGRLSRAFGP